MIDIGKKLLFTFCIIFENVQFFSHLHLKFATSAKNFVVKNINMSFPPCYLQSPQQVDFTHGNRNIWNRHGFSQTELG
jgi:hypothetical protein